MGNYNPRAPWVLGEEWVGIRDEDLVYAPSTSTTERGHGFTLTTSRQISTARFYLHDIPPDDTGNQNCHINVYTRGQEALSGPIREVIIPCQGGAVTGTALKTETAATTAAAVAASLAIPADGKVLRATYNAGASAGAVNLSFATQDYSQLLNGKRILSVELLYTGSVQDFNANSLPVAFVRPPDQQFFNMTHIATKGNSAAAGRLNGFIPSFFSGGTNSLAELATAPDPATGVFKMNDVGVVDFGGGDRTVPVALGTPSWSYTSLQNLDNRAADPSFIVYTAQVPTTTITGLNQARIDIEYMALRVTYVEETRVAIGSRAITAYAQGLNSVPVIHPQTLVASPTLAAGDYTVTLNFVSSGDLAYGQQTVGAFPKLNALRELYTIPTHPGYTVNIPFPLHDHVGDTFTRSTTSIIPQLSLHTTGGPITEPHVYGRQAAAQVYGSITATQVIYDDAAGVTASYPQVRYYARRFPGTTQPLVLTGVTPTITGSSVSLSVSAFDALPELVDGWKEVTLRFGTPPSMGTLATDPQWRWSATGEVAGSRWEVLGVVAPTISGVVANEYLSPAPTSESLAAGTYQPVAGSATNLTWMPQGISGPFVSGAAADTTADAALMFSQDPPTITGVTITPSSQALTGFTECGRGPCCIPSALAYNRVTWSPSSLPVSAFGAYELQRLDQIGNVWETIMLSTNIAVTGFNDYEARVGLTSSYQVRQRNVLLFNGAWSVTGTGTITAPGVTMPSCGTNKRGVLTFTSNASQAGTYNLAYAMVWDDDFPAEQFDFIEAGGVQVTQYLDRDYQIAFHGTERGGESFTRELVTANAAVALPRLANFRSLRDMAWADLPYVCVRDDLGDRWYATVIVPSGVVRRNRRLYNATITVVEVTGVPAQVNP